MGRTMKNRRQGFTVVELLVVCAILAIVGFAAVINVVARAPYFRMDSARLQVISDLRAARQAAVTRAVPVYVTFAASAKTYKIWVDGDNDGTVGAGEETTKTLADYPSMTMTVPVSTGSFSALGSWSCSSGLGLVKLTMNPVGSQNIYITPSGEVDSDT